MRRTRRMRRRREEIRLRCACAERRELKAKYGALDVVVDVVVGANRQAGLVPELAMQVAAQVAGSCSAGCSSGEGGVGVSVMRPGWHRDRRFAEALRMGIPASLGRESVVGQRLLGRVLFCGCGCRRKVSRAESCMGLCRNVMSWSRGLDDCRCDDGDGDGTRREYASEGQSRTTGS